MNDENHIDQQLRKPEGGGARIEMRDPRVSRAFGWLWTVIGAGAVTCVGLAANNLYQLNIAVNRQTDNNAQMLATISDHETRLRQMERDVSTLEGKVFRGVNGYQEPVEPRHGR